MLTEEQAREKWCPMVRLAEANAPPGYPSRNRGTCDSGVHPLCRCIASECMAWRWVIDNRSPAERCFADTGLSVLEWMKKYRENPASAGCNDHAAFDRAYGEPAQPTHGYCGAFGKPGDA